MRSVFNKINGLVYFSEQKIGIVFTSFLIAVLLVGIAMLYVTPHFTSVSMGVDYAALSEHPFDLSIDNIVRYRILSPLLGYITFLKGDLFVIVPLVFCFLFISAIVIYYRKKNYTPLESINMAAIICFSCTIFIPLSAAGYVDSITYFLLFISFICVRKPVVSALFFGLSLLNHECSLFLFPSLIVYSNYINRTKIIYFSKSILLYFTASIPYLCYRYYVSSHANVELDFHFYFSEQTIKKSVLALLPVFIPGLFFSFKLFWTFPIWAIIRGIISKSYSFVAILLLIIISCISQLIIAYDTTRLLCLLFPAILLSAEYIRDIIGTRRFETISTVIIIINFFVIQYIATSNELIRMLPVFWK